MLASRLPGCLLEAVAKRCSAFHPQAAAGGWWCCCGSMCTFLMSGDEVTALVPYLVDHIARHGGGGQSCSQWPGTAAVQSGGAHSTGSEAMPISSAWQLERAWKPVLAHVKYLSKVRNSGSCSPRELRCVGLFCSPVPVASRVVQRTGPLGLGSVPLQTSPQCHTHAAFSAAAHPPDRS